MNTLLAAVAAGVPVVAGWSAHWVWLRGRLTAARRDPLTGLWTREAFTRRAARLLRDPRAVVVLADVDHFKQVNDTHGHAAGDALLAATAARLAH
jgi:diguanylate cyclase (GGDEF)-like protein